MNNKNTVALLLGGNLGSESNYFQHAITGLINSGFVLLSKSSCYRTKPVDCLPGTPDFTNMALLGIWKDTPEKLLNTIQQLERIAGRPAIHSSQESRTLDCDIIIFGTLIINQPQLIIPHPRARKRKFVLEPLAEIAPNLIFPDTKETVKQSLEKLSAEKPEVHRKIIKAE